MGNRNKEAGIQTSFGGKAYGCGNISFNGERGGWVGGDGKMNTRIRESATFAGVVKVLNEC